MALDIGSASYGRSKETIMQLKNNVEVNYKALMKLFESSNEYYQKIMNTIDKNWVGADRYKKVIQSDINDLKGQANIVKKAIDTALDQALNEFLSFQNKN